MPTFLGKFKYVVDDKGRVNIPARFREQLAREADGTLAIIKGTDGCIFVYPLTTLDSFRASFEKSRFKSDKLARLFQRLLADGGSTGQPDGQGRVMLTEEQREHAGIQKDVVIFGNFQRIEIWDPERLKAHLAGARDRDLGIDDLASMFFKGGSVKTQE